MTELKGIELLAPARNLECGKEAILHGADAVYIGAACFGARQAAGNSVEDIASLAEFAHVYRAKVYVTVNTILREEELDDARKLVWNLYNAGVDAILVQDMALLEMDLPPIALHASTQADVRTPEKVRFLADCGFTRVVLARELSIDEIRKIHQECPDVELECFVHGALCVSYSGQCYASEYCFGRSANRGECAQFCRLPFDLIDSDGNVLLRQKHLLSLKDMKRIDYLEELADAGVCSFKIEGRLKELSYVKNVTAAYSQAIDKIILSRKDLYRSSEGNCTYQFAPSLDKSFNRGFTEYFLHGRNQGIFSFSTPKSMGEKMGIVRSGGRGWMSVTSEKTFHNGDGLCWLSADGKLQGCRVNRVEGPRIFLYQEREQTIPTGTEIYRNLDHEFENMLSHESSARKIGVDMVFSDIPGVGFSVTMTDGEGNSGTASREWNLERARNPQTENIKNQLSKLGNTEFRTDSVTVTMSDNWFVPSSLLSDLRREAVNSLQNVRRKSYQRPGPGKAIEGENRFPQKTLTYLGNVSNSMARSFYSKHAVETIEPAFEMKHKADSVIMFCRHCLRYAIGECPKQKNNKGNVLNGLALRSADGREFSLEFDCARCQMLVRV